MKDNIGSLIKKLGLKKIAAKTLNHQLFAQLLTAIDEAGSASLKNKELLDPKHISLRIGITGPPGAGKSTLISGLIQQFSNNDLSVAVLAVDPSSPFSHGALLGDRIRYHEALQNKNVFVRSIGTRGSMGGLSASAYLMLRAFDFAKFDITIIETVGVGQTELEIMNAADITTVVLVPESGDGIQLMKAGLMEIANIFVVNKSDRPGAESLIDELKNEMSVLGKKDIEIFSTVATNKKGIEELANYLILSIKNQEIKSNRFSTVKLQAEAKALLRMNFENEITKRVSKIKSVKDLSKLS